MRGSKSSHKGTPHLSANRFSTIAGRRRIQPCVEGIDKGTVSKPGRQQYFRRRRDVEKEPYSRLKASHRQYTTNLHFASRPPYGKQGVETKEKTIAPAQPGTIRRERKIAAGSGRVIGHTKTLADFRQKREMDQERCGMVAHPAGNRAVAIFRWE